MFKHFRCHGAEGGGGDEGSKLIFTKSKSRLISMLGFQVRRGWASL